MFISGMLTTLLIGPSRWVLVRLYSPAYHLAMESPRALHLAQPSSWSTLHQYQTSLLTILGRASVFRWPSATCSVSLGLSCSNNSLPWDNLKLCSLDWVASWLYEEVRIVSCDSTDVFAISSTWPLQSLLSKALSLAVSTFALLSSLAYPPPCSRSYKECRTKRPDLFIGLLHGPTPITCS